MKKLLAFILGVAGTYVSAQETQQIAPQQPAQVVANRAKTIRLHAYTTYAFDDNVDSYYSSTSYFNGKIEGVLSMAEAWNT